MTARHRANVDVWHQPAPLTAAAVIDHLVRNGWPCAELDDHWVPEPGEVIYRVPDGDHWISCRDEDTGQVLFVVVALAGEAHITLRAEPSGAISTIEINASFNEPPIASLPASRLNLTDLDRIISAARQLAEGIDLQRALGRRLSTLLQPAGGING
jgi:hypothetical protein